MRRCRERTSGRHAFRPTIRRSLPGQQQTSAVSFDHDRISKRQRRSVHEQAIAPIVRQPRKSAHLRREFCRYLRSFMRTRHAARPRRKPTKDNVESIPNRPGTVSISPVSIYKMTNCRPQPAAQQCVSKIAPIVWCRSERSNRGHHQGQTAINEHHPRHSGDASIAIGVAINVACPRRVKMDDPRSGFARRRGPSATFRSGGSS